MSKMSQPKLWEGIARRNRKWMRMVIITTVLIIGLMLLMLYLGNTIYSPAIIIKVLLGEEIKGASYAILSVRLPRMIAGLFAGIAFGMAGYIFQMVLRNSLASPDIIGVTTSTSTAAIFCISLLGLQGTVVSVIAVAVGLITSLIIVLLASKGGFSHTRMILIGIGVQALVHAVISYILSRISEHDMTNTMRWMSGSLNYAQMSDSIRILIVAVIGALILLAFSQHQKTIELGDEYAKTLGTNTARLYPVLIGIAVLMIAFSTAAVGPISSVSFLAGPIATRMAGRSKSGMIPAALTGAVLVLGADLIGQFVLPARYPVGIITGLIGGPYLLYLLVTMNRKGDSV